MARGKKENGAVGAGPAGWNSHDASDRMNIGLIEFAPYKSAATCTPTIGTSYHSMRRMDLATIGGEANLSTLQYERNPL